MILLAINRPSVKITEGHTINGKVLAAGSLHIVRNRPFRIASLKMMNASLNRLIVAGEGADGSRREGSLLKLVVVATSQPVLKAFPARIRGFVSTVFSAIL